MVCTSMHNYPLRKCVFSLWTLDSLFSKPQKKNGMKREPIQTDKITKEYMIIVHLPYPSLLGCGGRQENEGHCRWTTLDT